MHVSETTQKLFFPPKNKLRENRTWQIDEMNNNFIVDGSRDERETWKMKSQLDLVGERQQQFSLFSIPSSLIS